MSVATKKRAEIDDRRASVAKLYLRKVTQENIARQLGVNQATISRDITYLRKQWREQALSDVDTRRGLELAELEEMEFDAAIQFSQTKDAKWFLGRLRVKERIARMLGLDAPEQREISGKDGSNIIIKVSGGDDI